MASLVSELNRVSYVAEDFASFQSEAKAFYAAQYPADYNDLISTNLGNAIIDQLAFAMQAITFTVNRRATELFMDTARLNKSIVKIARMLGYPISPGAPSSVNATIVFPGAPFTVPVSIPTGFQFQGPGSIIYEYVGAANAVLAVGQTQLVIPLSEGQTKILNFVSDGSENQQFSIFGVPSGQFLYSDQFVVTVDGTEWQRLDLIKYENTSIYEVLFTDDPPKLRFGDNIAGQIPPANAAIGVSLRYGFGLAGAIGSNQILAPVADLVVNGVTIDMTITNPAADAGSDPEDIRHVKAFASSFFRTQNAAVVKDDYDTIAQLQAGVALADAQIVRGINNDITIQAAFAAMLNGMLLLNDSVSGMAQTSVSGLGAVGVAGVSGLFVDGQSGLAVGGLSFLGVSGAEFLGADVSGNVTGVSFLGVSGLPGLQVIGQSGLLIGGSSSLGVSGTDQIGVELGPTFITQAVSGSELIAQAMSSLSGYLSNAFSDTSVANQVQVVVLGVDASNRYIAPSQTMLTTIQTTLQNLADAVVTVIAVDGSSRIVNVDINVTLGLSQTAVQSDVENLGLQALIQSISPYGLLVRRTAGASLYDSDIEQAILAANQTGDIAFINIEIVAPTSMLDQYGNLIISQQQVIQNGNISVKALGRFVGKTFIPFT
jgi:hypothetical protein